MVLAAWRAEEICTLLGVRCVITSANDSRHMPGSKHYSGRALDFRTKHIDRGAGPIQFRDMLTQALGPQYTVILEDFAGENEHIHVQFNGT